MAVSIPYWIVLFCLLIGVSSVLAAAIYLLVPQSQRQHIQPHLISFAIGTLLGAAFLALLPHALELSGIQNFHRITATVLVGLLLFFLMEKMVLWRHCHHDHCEAHHARESVREHDGITSPLILFGSSVHNLIHGVLIAAAFLVDIDLGIVTSLAVLAHQVPQELSNFAVLLNAGRQRGQALLLSITSSLTAPVGGIIGYYGLAGMTTLMPYMLALAVSSCIYIAVADLLPGLHKRTHLHATAQQILLILMGVGVIYISHQLLH